MNTLFLEEWRGEQRISPPGAKIRMGLRELPTCLGALDSTIMYV
jgi:hypothetical protein